MVKHYNMLASANTQKDVPNPFFYVSSSEWNLYYYLTEIFSFLTITFLKVFFY